MLAGTSRVCGSRILVFCIAVAVLLVAAGSANSQGENLALKAKATASSEFPGGGFDAARAIDGKETTRWNDNCGGGEQWFELAWDSPIMIGKVIIKQAYDRIGQYTIHAWDEAKKDFVPAFTGTGPSTGRIDINQTLTADFSPPVTTSKLRITFDKFVSCVSIWELEVYAPAKVNLALGASATASSEFPGGGFDAARAIDGKETTRWNDDCAEAQPWIAIEWQSPQTFNKVVVKQAYDRVQEYTLDIWDPTKNDWVVAFTGTGPGTGRIDINHTLVATFSAPVTTTKLRFSSVRKVSCVSIWELEVYNVKFGTVYGVVTDASGNPVAGATVQAGDASTLTDAKGAYSLVVDPGVVNVVASKPGEYKTRTARNVSVPDGGNVERNITLFKLPPNLALTATAIASTESSAVDPETGEPTQDAPKAIDGKMDTRWQSATPVEGEPESITLVWEKPQTFNRVAIKEFSDTIREYKLQRFDEARGDFVDIITRQVPKLGGDPLLSTALPSPVTTKQLRILFTGFAPSTTLNAISIFEITVEQAPLGSIAGKVVDVYTDKPVPNASVIAEPGGLLGVTDDGGNFTAVLDADDYLLRAEAEGFFEGRPTLVSVLPDQTVSAVVKIPAKGENLALKAKVSASTEDFDAEAAKAIDRDTNTYWGSSGEEEGYEAGRVMNAWIQFDWTAPVTFNRVIILEFGDRSREIQVQAWDDNKKDWVEVGSDVSPGGGADVDILHTIDLKSPATTKSMRIFVPTGANPPRFREVEVYNFVLPAEEEVAVVKGDLNGDGKVGIPDATLALRIAVGLQQATPEQLKAGDLNGNGKIEIAEVTQVLRAAVGLGKL